MSLGPHASTAANRFPALLGASLAAAAALALSGCGGDDRDASGSTPRAAPNGTSPGRGASQGDPALAFPPQAYEPATSKGGGPTPAGRVVRIGGRPEGIAVDSGSGVVGVALDDASHGFALLDATTLKVRRTVPLPGAARHVTAWGRSFLVPLEKTDQLAQVDSGAGGGLRLIDVGVGPHAVAGSENQLFVGDELGGTVTVIRNGDPWRVRATVPVDVQPGGIADAGLGRIAVVSVRANTIELLNAKSLRTGGSQNAGYGPSHAVASTDDGRVFVADTRGGAILVYATRPRLKFVDRLVLGGSPYGLALDPDRHRLWVTDSGADRLDLVDTMGALKVARSYPTVRQPNTVATDTRTGAAYVLGHANGELQKID